MSPTDGAGPGTCGCCAGTAVRTPAAIHNRPGLSAIAYRVGAHGEFLASLLSRLSSLDHPALARLRTRERDDWTVALLDAFACCADVLTFYQERLANEAFLATATERRSLVELARLIGYRPRPGAAAEAHVAFTLETAQGAPERLALEAGVKVQSVPGPGETPHTFETVEAIEARPAWNALPARRTRRFVPGFGDTECWLRGTNLNLKPGDGLLLVGREVARDGARENWDFRPIRTVEVGRETTHVTWAEGLGSREPHVDPARDPEVHVFRRRAAVFGHNAPMWALMPQAFRDLVAPADPDGGWPNFTISEDADSVDLDASHPDVVPDSWIVLAKPTWVELYRVERTTERSRADFAVSAKVTRVKLRSPALEHPENYACFREAVRETSVHAAPERLELADAPETGHVRDQEVLVDGDATALAKGRTLVVAGRDAATGEPDAQVVTLDEAVAEGGGTRLLLREKLAHPYARESVVVHANVARATEGETVRQVLGTGDASRAHERFALRHAPLAFLAAENEAGATSTLEVRADDLAWHEVPTLFGAGADDRCYALRVEDDGTAVVRFGDGVHGARLPTGVENVRARYRKGLGRAGNVAAGALTQVLTPALGLKAATNPRPAEGGVDPEGPADLRRNLPLGVRTLGRAVSLRDYEDFARAFTGIAKAHAAVVNAAAGRTVVVTVGLAGGAGPGPEHPTLARLAGALRRSGDPTVRFEILPYEEVTFRLAVLVKRAPEHEREGVLGAVEAALRAAFSFDARELGRPVHRSQVFAVVQRVRGVVGADVALHAGTATAPADRLLAEAPRAGAAGQALAAQLLVLAPGPLDRLEEMP
jgi:predicted phage baseplate assembly protein